MKSKILLPCKLFLLVLLFVVGFVLAGAVFPSVTFVCSQAKAMEIKDLIKMYWLKCFSQILQLKVVCIGNVPKETGMIVSNHISWIDIVAIGQLLPAYFVAKSDILGWPVIGYLADQAGTIFIRRGDKKNILITAEKMLSTLNQGGSIIAFPEGTTTEGDDVLGFHSSLFQPAIQSQVMVQPVSIRYVGDSRRLAPFVGDDTFVMHLLRMLKMDQINVELRFLTQLDVKLGRNVICEQARTMILEQVVSA